MFEFIKRFFNKKQTAWPEFGRNAVDVLSIVSTGHPERGDLVFRIRYKYSNDPSERLFVAAQENAKEYKTGNLMKVAVLTPDLADKLLLLRSHRSYDIGKYRTFPEWLLKEGPEEEGKVESVEE